MLWKLVSDFIWLGKEAKVMVILPSPPQKSIFCLFQKLTAASFMLADRLTSESSFNKVSLMIFYNLKCDFSLILSAMWNLNFNTSDFAENRLTNFWFVIGDHPLFVTQTSCILVTSFLYHTLSCSHDILSPIVMSHFLILLLKF